MSNDPIKAANQIGNRARHISTNVTHIVTALRTVTPDGYPTGGSGTRGSGHSDPTAGAALSRTEGTGPGYLPADWYDLLLDQLAVIQAALDVIDQIHAEWVRGSATDRDRCSGLVNPACTELRASPDHEGLCVTCTTKACRRCWRKPSEQRRSPITGEPTCEACYRRERRSA